MAELAGIETVLFLQSTDLFRHCSAEQILRLATIAHERRFDAGEAIYRIDEEPSVLYCVVQGRVALEDGVGERREVGPLLTFGVADILCGRLRSQNAVAVADTLVLTMDAEDLFDLLANNIEIVRALFKQFLPPAAAPSPGGGAP